VLLEYPENAQPPKAAENCDCLSLPVLRVVIVVGSIVVVGECCLSLWSQVMVHEPSGAAASSTRAGEAKSRNEMLEEMRSKLRDTHFFSADNPTF
jgi:hypothetical protein